MAEGEAIEDEVRLTLRLPAILRNRIFNETHKTGRSLNGEIVYRLEKSLTDDNTLGRLDTEVAELWGKIDELEYKVREHDQQLHPQRYDRD